MSNKIPIWSEPTLQGIAYWLGYKKQFYRDYPLSEGAIVAEALQLINSNITKGEKLTCEDLYKKLGLVTDKKTRADIAIWENDKPTCVIEVKKTEAGRQLIDLDICKLGELKKQNNNIRCFLLVVSQNKKPNRFVNEKGVAETSKLNISGISVKTRRVCKTTSNFNSDKSINSAHYACLIEVL